MQTSYGFKRYGVCIYDTQQLFIGDVLLFLSVRRRSKFLDKSVCPEPQRTLINTNVMLYLPQAGLSYKDKI